jgi:hypothetical protein
MGSRPAEPELSRLLQGRLMSGVRPSSVNYPREESAGKLPLVTSVNEV